MSYVKNLFSFFACSSLSALFSLSCHQTAENSGALKPGVTHSSQVQAPSNQVTTSPSKPTPPSISPPPASSPPSLPPPSALQIQDARSISRVFAQIAAQVGPSVVSIKVEKEEKARTLHRRDLPFPFGSPFGAPDEEDEAPGNLIPERKRVQKGAGSGFVIDEKGYIVTNNHVAGGASKILITFPDRTDEFEASIIGTDPRSDLAVIKINDLKGYTPKVAIWGDSDILQVAEWVLAIGNPFGLDHTVTVGVISAKGRHGLPNPNVRFQEFLQTDASINPGNSGGPLINLQGEVIGINTAILGPGGNIGIGFAIPSNLAKPIIQELMQSGKIERSYLGIAMKDLTTDEVEFIKNTAKVEVHVKVEQVQKNSPADKAQIYPGDYILGLDGTPVSSARDIQKYVLSKKPHTQIKVSLLGRNGKPRTATLETDILPPDSTSQERPRAIPQPFSPEE